MINYVQWNTNNDSVELNKKVISITNDYGINFNIKNIASIKKFKSYI
jgi:hypothetical protein